MFVESQFVIQTSFFVPCAAAGGALHEITKNTAKLNIFHDHHFPSLISLAACSTYSFSSPSPSLPYVELEEFLCDEKKEERV
jgi:hypothetical protein